MLEALRQEQLAGNQQPAAAEGQIGHFHAADNLPGQFAWIEGDYKLHRIPVKNATQFNYELYHLGNDPAEANNLLEEMNRALPSASAG